MPRHPDVLIVGGGVIGLTTAYFLARDGVSVRVLDQSAPGTEASWAGAGILPPGNPAGARAPLDRLRAESSAMFPGLSAELRGRTGIDNGYRACGGIEVFDGDPPDATHVWRAEGIPFERLSPLALERIEPAVRVPTGDCFFLPGMAQVRNPWHLRALLAACQQDNVEVVRDAPAAGFQIQGDTVAQVFTTTGEKYGAGNVLIASGAWSDRLLSLLGAQAGIHPVRGQVVLFRTPTPLLRRVVCVGKRYLVPRDDGRVLVGSTEEPEAGFEKRTTEAGVTSLAEWAQSMVPGLASAEIERTWAGLRPGTPDGLPFIGPVPGYRNAFAATGHFRAGIQLSPATARVMADLMTGRTPSIPLQEFRLGRPPGRPAVPAFRS